MPIKIFAELLRIDGRSVFECGCQCLNSNEAVPSKWREQPYRISVSRDDVGITFVEPAHYLATVIPQLSLSNFYFHSPTVARRATRVSREFD